MLLSVVAAAMVEMDSAVVMARIQSGSCVLVELPGLLGCTTSHEDDSPDGRATAGIGKLVFAGCAMGWVPAHTHTGPFSAGVLLAGQNANDDFSGMGRRRWCVVTEPNMCPPLSVE